MMVLVNLPLSFLHVIADSRENAGLGRIMQVFKEKKTWWVIFYVYIHLTCSTWGDTWDEWNERKTCLKKKVWGHWGFNYDLKEACLCKTTNFQTWYHKVKCSFVTSGKKECPPIITGETLQPGSIRSHVGEQSFSHLSLSLSFFSNVHTL